MKRIVGLLGWLRDDAARDDLRFPRLRTFRSEVLKVNGNVIQRHSLLLLALEGLEKPI